MRRIENDCCDCAVPGYPCLGTACPLTHAIHYYCDRCGEELWEEDAYRVDDEDLCEDCLQDMFRVNLDDKYE